MPDIKTRDVVKGTIKQLDKAAVAADRMKHAYVATKDKAEQSTQPVQASAEEYASDSLQSGMDKTAHAGVRQFDKQGRKAVSETKENVVKAKDKIEQFKEKRAESARTKNRASQAESTRPRSSSSNLGGTSAENARSTVSDSFRSAGKKSVKAVDQTSKKTIKQTARSAGKKTVKTVEKGAAKTAKKTVKTAEKTAKTAIKTTKEAAKAAQKTAQAAAKAAQRAAQMAKAAAKALVTGIKLAVKATIAAVKAIIAATKALIAAIAAGGWVAVVVIIVICLIALIIGSVFGIFFSGEDSGTGLSMPAVVQEINTDYDTQLQTIKDNNAHDVLEMSGGTAVWKEVLSVYSVKVNSDPDNPQEVATMDDGKKQILKDIFWEMNSISSRTESKTETVVTETDDGHGNIIVNESTVTRTYLYITVTHKTADEMAAQYGFSDEQKEYLAELLSDENNSLWASVLYGITAADGQIVTVALSQVGNVGGQPYWSWYGFGSRVEWCACFVSWCAKECGYIDSGVIPKFSGCTQGVQWFKERGQWADKSAEPVPGMIIFFDWDDEEGQDGEPDHVGIVEKVDNGTVYTVEGNSGDSCRINQYSIGYYEIFGYGIPAY